MRVILLGTGYAIPTAERVHTSVLVKTTENMLLLDCGSGVLHRLSQAGYDSADINAVLHTHHHLDHNSDLMALLKANWMKERTTMKIFGPAGTKLWLERLFEAYSYLKDRIDLKIKELSDDGLIRLGKDIIICRSVEHGPDALAYKVVSEDVSVVYSGDTQPCRAIAELSTGADLLIHECNFLTKDMRGIKGHSNPFTIGDVYANIGVKKLALVHLPPRIQEYREQVLKTVEKYFDEIIIGEDLLTLEL